MPKFFPFILNVISPEADVLAGPLRAIAAEYGAAAGEVTWLAPGHAFDVPFLDHPEAALSAARAAAARMIVDINLVAAANRRKKLLIADMESTIIDCECLDELASCAGLKEKIAQITERAMRGEIDFEGALKERVTLLKGLPTEALEQVYRARLHFNPGARELVATMKAQGATTMLVSGGFSFFAERVAKACGFERWQANELAIEDDRLTGEVVDPVLDRDSKLDALKEAASAWRIPLSDTFAVGDGANDVAMVEAAGLGVGYRPKPVLAQAADAVIAHGDLTSLLYLQGYRADEIVAA